MKNNVSTYEYRGFALPTVVFLLVVVAMLLAMMVRLSGQQSASVDLVLLGAKADMAARSAIEWATYRIKSNDACPGAAPAIDGFAISVTCTPTSYSEGSTTGATNRFRYDLQIRVESAGGNRTSPDYAFRELNVTLMVEK